MPLTENYIIFFYLLLVVIQKNIEIVNLFLYDK